MLKFSHFKILKEELSDQQKRTVAKMYRDPEAVAATDHYFGKGNDDIHQELAGTQNKSEVHKAVERHLGTEIEPAHYKEGVMPDKYGRMTKIGRQIKDKGLQTQFANDSTRQGKKFTGLSVHVTRSPAGVCGQTSGDQSWAGISCKNFDTGKFRNILPHEVEHGTVVGYLKDHTGKELSRITLQPHINDEGHRAYAIDSEYGIDHEEFKKHMNRVAADLSGEHKSGNLIYKKHPDVYDDSGKTEIIHPNATREHISNALNDNDDYVRKAAARHPKLTSEDISKSLNDKNYNVRAAALENPNITSEHISKALNDSDYQIRDAAVRHPNATAEHISKALNDDNDYVRGTAIRHPNATTEHISKALNDTDQFVRAEAIKHPNATAEHYKKALTDSHELVRFTAGNHMNYNQKYTE